ncbi:L-threonylcarbamoyladenylate synthase [Acinetobacter sp. WZC-1]|uniref:L-threonylcarbamoyladenylate synthase n=1 Tax=Acinetobacter sp. WZC-1 TaxID=3459034 RepID=UPI00403D9D31
MITTSVTEAAEFLTQGKVLAYPTETVWGLGCDPYNEQAFQAILQLKQRPAEKGVILLAGQISQIEHLLTQVDDEIRLQIINSWTQRTPAERATTWLLPADDSIPQWIKGQHAGVAVRVSTHPLCTALCNAFNGFIVSTSANPSGMPPAQSLQQARQYFGSRLNYLNGDPGMNHQSSKIIDAMTGKVIRA